MGKTMRLTSFTVAFAMILSLLQILLISIPVHAAMLTWSGLGGDDNFSTDANWVGGTAPVAGDDLVFDNDTADFFNEFPFNDFADYTSFNSILLRGSESDGLTLRGSSIDFAGDVTNSNTGFAPLTLDLDITTSATVDLAGSAAIYIGIFGGLGTLEVGANVLNVTNTASATIYSAITGTNTITNSGSGDLIMFGDNSSFDGAINLTNGRVFVNTANALGSTTGATLVSSGAQLYFSPGLNSAAVDIGEDITIGGSGIGPNKLQTAIVVVASSGKGGGIESENPTANDLTLSGTVTLSADTTISTDEQMAGSAVRFSDLQLGGNQLNIVEGTPGTIVYGGNSYTGTQEKVSISDDLPATDVSAASNSELTITGSRGNAGVQRNAVLKGDGTVADLFVYSGGTLAPGLSPGCMNSNNLTFSSGSTFEVEIDGATVCTQYDQMDVIGTVTLGNAILDLQVAGSYTPDDGETFTIIDNDAADAVVGTFSGLAEGATITANGIDYFISYTGVDGNDVVLTASIAATPGAPDTGVSLLRAQPILAAAVTCFASLMMVGIGYRHKQTQEK